ALAIGSPLKKCATVASQSTRARARAPWRNRAGAGNRASPRPGASRARRYNMAMRPALLALIVALAISAAPASQGRSDPFIPIGVWYGGGTARAPMVPSDPAGQRDVWRRDLQDIRALGFNSIRTGVSWASAEPERGRYRFDALDQLLALAGEAGLKVILQVFT